jgi:hypothetical protein
MQTCKIILTRSNGAVAVFEIEADIPPDMKSIINLGSNCWFTSFSFIVLEYGIVTWFNLNKM